MMKPPKYSPVLEFVGLMIVVVTIVLLCFQFCGCSQLKSIDVSGGAKVAGICINGKVVVDYAKNGRCPEFSELPDGAQPVIDENGDLCYCVASEDPDVWSCACVSPEDPLE